MASVAKISPLSGTRALTSRCARALQGRALPRVRCMPRRSGYTSAVLKPTVATMDLGLLLAAAEYVAADADTYKYGEVAAPPFALIGLCAVVTLAATASIFFLQPGADAAIEMQKRDAETFNKTGRRK